VKECLNVVEIELNERRNLLKLFLGRELSERVTEFASELMSECVAEQVSEGPE